MTIARTSGSFPRRAVLAMASFVSRRDEVLYEYAGGSYEGTKTRRNNVGALLQHTELPASACVASRQQQDVTTTSTYLW